jgi:hypothetical protein
MRPNHTRSTSSSTRPKGLLDREIAASNGIDRSGTVGILTAAGWGGQTKRSLGGAPFNLNPLPARQT